MGKLEGVLIGVDCNSTNNLGAAADRDRRVRSLLGTARICNPACGSSTLLIRAAEQGGLLLAAGRWSRTAGWRGWTCG